MKNIFNTAFRAALRLDDIVLNLTESEEWDYMPFFDILLRLRSAAVTPYMVERTNYRWPSTDEDEEYIASRLACIARDNGTPLEAYWTAYDLYRENAWSLYAIPSALLDVHVAFTKELEA